MKKKSFDKFTGSTNSSNDTLTNNNNDANNNANNNNANMNANVDIDNIDDDFVDDECRAGALQRDALLHAIARHVERAGVFMCVYV